MNFEEFETYCQKYDDTSDLLTVEIDDIEYYSDNELESISVQLYQNTSDPYISYYHDDVEASDMEAIANADNLYCAFRKCCKGVDWKGSVQGYMMNALHYIRLSQRLIRSGEYREKDMTPFTLNERGHVRYIQPEHITDRVVLRSFIDNVLMPQLERHIINSNTASQKGKGISYARKLFEKDLHNAYLKYGEDGYVLLIDFSKYFDNLLHECIMKQFSKFLYNNHLMEFMKNYLDHCSIDVSYMNDDEFQHCYESVFNSLEYSKLSFYHSGKRMMRKSVGIGSPVAQQCGIYYPHEIDIYCTIVKGCKFYGRYMDDTYIMGKKSDLKLLLKELVPKYKSLGIHVNLKKTKIIPIIGMVSYLKINYITYKNGKIIKKVNSGNIHREYRRLTRYYHLYHNNGNISLDDIYNSYRSWRGGFIKYDSKKEIEKVDKHFIKLFGNDMGKTISDFYLF